MIIIKQAEKLESILKEQKECIKRIQAILKNSNKKGGEKNKRAY